MDNNRDFDTNVTGSRRTADTSDRQWGRYAVIAAVLIVGLIALMMLLRDPATGPDGTSTGAGSGDTGSVTRTTPSTTPTPPTTPTTPTPGNTPAPGTAPK